MPNSEDDERELGERAAKGIRNENASKAHTRAAIAGRGVQRELRQRPADRANRQQARGGRG